MSQKGLPTGQIAVRNEEAANGYCVCVLFQQVHMPSGPADRRSIERSQPPIERIDDIIILPDEKKSGFVQTTTITTEGGVHVRNILNYYSDYYFSINFAFFKNNPFFTEGQSIDSADQRNDYNDKERC